METTERLGSRFQNPGKRRHAPRVSILTGLGEVVVVNIGSQTGLLLDLANGGLAVQAVYPILRQASTDIAFPLPFTGDRIEAVCKVAWVDEGGRTGLQFLRIANGPKHRLDRWLAKYREKDNGVAGVVPETEPLAQATDGGSRQAAEATGSRIPAAALGLSGAEQIGSSSAASEILTEAVGLARRLTCADGAAIVLCEPEGVICRASVGEAPDVGSQLQSHSGFTAECLRTGDVVFSSDVENDSRAHPATVKRLRLRSLLIVPIRLENSIVGAVEVLSCRPAFFELKQATTLQAIADTVASAWLPTLERKAQEEPCATASGVQAALAQPFQLLSRARLAARSRIAAYRVAAPLLLAFGRTTASVAQAALAQLIQSLNRARMVARSRTGPYLITASLLLAFWGVLILERSWQKHSVATPVSHTELPDEHAAAAKQEMSSEKTADSSFSREPHPVRPQKNGIGTTLAERRQVTIGRTPVSNDRAPVEAARRATPEILAPSSGSSGSRRMLQFPTTAPAPVQVIGARPARKETSAGDALGSVTPPVGLYSTPQKDTLLASLFDAPPPVPRLSGPSRRPRISEGVILGRAISQPLPPYPEQARQLGVQGSVILRGVIAADGRLSQMQVLEGNPVLTRPALDAVKNWRFTPTYLNRVPIETETVDELKFSLDKSPQVSMPLHVPEGIVRGRPISQPLPAYPELLRHFGFSQLGEQGSVIVRGVIDADGRMKQLRVVHGNRLLAQSVLDAVSRWRYEPSYLNGKVVEVDTTVVVNFRP